MVLWYDVLRAVHIIAVIGWVAGMLMLPRLCVYQLEASPGGETFQTMDAAIKRLRHIILTPTMILTWILGIALIVVQWPVIMSHGWMHAKLLIVLLLAGAHGYFVSLSKKISTGTATITPKRLRMLNEVPFVLVILAVFAVVLEPF